MDPYMQDFHKLIKECEGAIAKFPSVNNENYVKFVRNNHVKFKDLEMWEKAVRLETDFRLLLKV